MRSCGARWCVGCRIIAVRMVFLRFGWGCRGIDSALVLAIAVDALGADQVTAVRLPSRYTAELSNDLAAEQCRGFGG